ncbi:MAG: aldo/keto reductase [Chitinispirillaceae bacterium]
MEKRRLGNSDMDISRIGLGTWAIGGSWRYGWGHQEDKDSLATIHRAVERGVNWIDTAAIYGLGHSEEVVGKALKELSVKPYVFTKCGLRWKTEDNPKREGFPILKAKSVREEAENSLRRLDVEVIDLYQIHWPNPAGDIEEAWSEMAKLKKEGKVRWIGVSNHNVAQMERLRRIAPITSLQPPYNIINRMVEKAILPYCAENDIGTIVYSPMNAGLLTGKMTRERVQSLPEDDWRKHDVNFNEPKFSRNMKIVEAVGRVAQSKGVSSAEIAVAWTLKNPAVTAAIVGMRRPDQVDSIMGAADIELTSEDIREIEEA